ncbi:hypothetical protein [Paradevosia shaoguanensis]|uniref:hypothetical protein n=1 Tax=Paradevosia shaoguanensis TaxID=1335043 RepID=UPI00193185CE|nr:hypothetical protein [Paradevosia shaoguanensis]
MGMIDLEDLIDEYNLAQGLPPAQRNPPRAPAASDDMPVPTKTKRPRRPRMVQTDLIEFLEADKAAEAATAISEPARPAVSSDFGTDDARQQPSQPVQENAAQGVGSIPPSTVAGVPAMACGIGTEDHSLRFLKEVVHIQKEPKPPTQHDYRHLLRPIQTMLSPSKGKGPAVCACGHARKKAVSVHLIERANGTERASVTGIFRCGNGEACPLCARHVAALRARRYRLVHEATTARGGKVVTFVLTIEHARDDRLGVLMKALKSAATRSRGDRLWNDEIAPLMQVVGAMTDTHVRLSRRGGWHPHLHVSIACLTDDMEALKAGASMLLDSYIAKLAALGYRAAKTQQSATILDAKPNAYPAHHHRRAEVTGKLADAMDDDTSLSPFDIAELAANGDVEMQGYFREFVEAVRGQKSGVITASMAKKLGIEPGTDPGPTFDETSRLGTIPATVWTKLLDLNLTGTFLTHVETFRREGWLRSRWWALEQTNEAPEYSTELAAEIAELIHAQQRMPDPIAKRLAQDQIEILKGDWTWTHGAELVAGTVEYVAANHRHMRVDTEGVNIWVSVLEDSAARRHPTSHTTLPVGDNTPSTATVSHGSIPDHVGQNTPISQQA